MMIKIAARIRGAAVSLRPGYFIDRFLDWLEELSVVIAPRQLAASPIATCQPE